MDEQRKYFRIKNTGEIQASFNNHALEVIDLSASSAALRTEKELPAAGIIELKINQFTLDIAFELLRVNPDHSVILVFTQEEQIEKLFPVLKNLRK